MNDQKDPYSDLFIDDNLDREMLAETVKPYLKLTLDGKFRFLPGFTALSQGRQLLCLLLGRKILKDAEKIQNEEIHVDEAANLLRIPKSNVEGNIYGKIKDFVEVKDANIWIPNYNIEIAKQYLEKK